MTQESHGSEMTGGPLHNSTGDKAVNYEKQKVGPERLQEKNAFN